MRKVTVFFLLIVFLCNAAGFYNVYQFQKRKRDTDFPDTQFRGEDLLKVKFSAKLSIESKGFKRLEKNEYQRKNRRYDVIRREKKTDSITVYLVHDSYEEELLSFLRSFFDTGRHSNKQNRAASNFKGAMIKQFLKSRPSAFQHSLAVSYKIHLQTRSLPSWPYLEVAVPPPKLA